LLVCHHNANARGPGPIIRISPHAIHVNDPDFYDIYSGRVGEKRNKYKWALTHFNTPEAMLATVDHSHHRMRRAPVAPFFSKSNVRKLDYVLHENIAKFRTRLREMEVNGEPFNILNGFKALTSDVITTYAL
jgi:cytochrome P450